MSLSRCPTHISVCPSETISHLRSKIKSSSLIISRPLLPYGYIYKASCAGPDKKNPIPSKLNRHLYFLTSGHSDAQPWASECPDVKNYKWRLNPVWHRMLHMATVGVKGLSWLSWRYNALLGVKLQIYKQTAMFRCYCCCCLQLWYTALHIEFALHAIFKLFLFTVTICTNVLLWKFCPTHLTRVVFVSSSTKDQLRWHQFWVDSTVARPRHELIKQPHRRVIHHSSSPATFPIQTVLYLLVIQGGPKK